MWRGLFVVVAIAALNAVPLLSFHQRATSTPSRAVLVRAADASGAASDVVASVTDLSQALRTPRGFVIAQSFQQADAIVEVLDRRQLGRRLGVHSTSEAAVDMIRTHITLGDDTAELRGYSGFAHQFSVSAPMDAANASS